MEIIGQKVKTKAGNTVTIKKIDKGLVYVSQYDDGGVGVPLDALIMDDELKAEIQSKLSVHKEKPKKVLTGVAGIIDVRRAPEELCDPKTIEVFHKGDCFGTRAADTYWDFCDNPNVKFNEDVGWNFGRQERLYAQNATVEGYSVWMLAHSTYNGSTAKSGKVVNVIEENCDIVEKWNDDANIPDLASGEKRIVFIKNACGQYIFWGMMEMAEVRHSTKEVVFRYVSDTYKADIKNEK